MIKKKKKKVVIEVSASQFYSFGLLGSLMPEYLLSVSPREQVKLSHPLIILFKPSCSTVIRLSDTQCADSGC